MARAKMMSRMGTTPMQRRKAGELLLADLGSDEDSMKLLMKIRLTEYTMSAAIRTPKMSTRLMKHKGMLGEISATTQMRQNQPSIEILQELR